MNKQDVINYVLETPENINPAILGQFLDEIGGDEGEGEVWATYIQEEDTENFYSVSLEIYNGEVECYSGTSTTKTATEWKNFQKQLDGEYTAKLKGYFSDFPTVELYLNYLGKDNNPIWEINWYDTYDENIACVGEGEIESGENFEVENLGIYIYYNNDGTQIYPTKMELIVYKK